MIESDQDSNSKSLLVSSVLLALFVVLLLALGYGDGIASIERDEDDAQRSEFTSESVQLEGSESRAIDGRVTPQHQSDRDQLSGGGSGVRAVSGVLRVDVIDSNELIVAGAEVHGRFSGASRRLGVTDEAGTLLVDSGAPGLESLQARALSGMSSWVVPPVEDWTEAERLDGRPRAEVPERVVLRLRETESLQVLVLDQRNATPLEGIEVVAIGKLGGTPLLTTRQEAGGIKVARGTTGRDGIVHLRGLRPDEPVNLIGMGNGFATIDGEGFPHPRPDTHVDPRGQVVVLEALPVFGTVVRIVDRTNGLPVHVGNFEVVAELRRRLATVAPHLTVLRYKPLLFHLGFELEDVDPFGVGSAAVAVWSATGEVPEEIVSELSFAGGVVARGTMRLESLREAPQESELFVDSQELDRGSIVVHVPGEWNTTNVSNAVTTHRGGSIIEIEPADGRSVAPIRAQFVPRLSSVRAFRSIPAGLYRVRVTDPWGHELSLAGADDGVVSVVSGEETSIRIASVDSASLELSVTNSLGQLHGGALFVQLLEETDVPGDFMGVTVEFRAPPFVIPRVPEGSHILKVEGAARTSELGAPVWATRRVEIARGRHVESLDLIGP